MLAANPSRLTPSGRPRQPLPSELARVSPGWVNPRCVLGSHIHSQWLWDAGRGIYLRDTIGGTRQTRSVTPIGVGIGTDNSAAGASMQWDMGFWDFDAYSFTAVLSLYVVAAGGTTLTTWLLNRGTTQEVGLRANSSGVAVLSGNAQATVVGTDAGPYTAVLVMTGARALVACNGAIVLDTTSTYTGASSGSGWYSSGDNRGRHVPTLMFAARGVIPDAMAVAMSINPYPYLFDNPINELYFAPAGGVPTLSASTYVAGSLTSTGWRPQVTAS